jgi:glycyl-tRNA synthetase alpha subunit
MNGLLLDALYAKYQADKADAVARLDIYLNNSVGIGEHPQHTEEMDQLIAQYADAEDKRQTLTSMIANIKNYDAVIDGEHAKDLLKG